jgi:hypothetical protein
MATSHGTAERAKKEIPYRLPLVIGATGHRDLRDDDIPALVQEVKKAIERLKSEYLHNDPETPIIVLSSLAEGGDRLIAQAAMDLDAQLIAPLPMEENEYRRDFTDPKRWVKPDAVIDFDRLKELAVATPVMGFAEGNTAANVSEDARRDLQYREVGLFIVRHCHVLIALWDGDKSNTATGGTAEVVRFKRDGIPFEVSGSAQATLDAPEIGPVIHIATPRDNQKDRDSKVAACPWGREIDKSCAQGGREIDARCGKVQENQIEAWKNFAAQVALTRRFNDEAAGLEGSAKRAPKLDKSLQYLFDDPEPLPDKKISGEPAKKAAMELIPHWCRLYQIADTLAQEWQARFKRDWRLLFGLGFGALVIFEVLTHLFFDRPGLYWVLAIYVVIFIATFGLFIYARRHWHQERFLDYRALAEALRVAVFWKLVGIGWPLKPGSPPPAQATVDLSSGDSVAKAYPIRQPRELDWVKTCLRTLELLDSDELPAKVGHNFEADGHPWARAFWVHGQLEFFRLRGPAHEDEAARLLRGFFALVVIAVFLAAWLCIADLFFHWEHLEPRHRILIFLVGLLPGVAAVFAGYAERLALEAQARQYDRMRALFARAHEILQSHPPVKFRLIQALYGELGAEAMKENAEWVAIYRQRPIRPP